MRSISESASVALVLDLAELFQPPLDGMERAAKEWQFYAHLQTYAQYSSSAQRAIRRIAAIPAESLAKRHARYAHLFGFVDGPPRFWLYESVAKFGRILSQVTYEIERLYRAAGVALEFGAELPDHLSLELAFLAHLFRQMESRAPEAVEWRSIALQFIKKHGDWIIRLGQGLAKCGDEVYAPIGAFLAEWFSEMMEMKSPPFHMDPPRPPSKGKRIPTLKVEQDCNLCGFCVQACPTRALGIIEDEVETRLVLNLALCRSCGKCIPVCEQNVLRMSASFPQDAQLEGNLTPSSGHLCLLRSSQRVVCPGCGRAMVSRAEMDYVAERLGHPTWLEYCLDCRAHWMSVGG